MNYHSWKERTVASRAPPVDGFTMFEQHAILHKCGDEQEKMDAIESLEPFWQHVHVPYEVDLTVAGGQPVDEAHKDAKLKRVVKQLHTLDLPDISFSALLKQKALELLEGLTGDLSRFQGIIPTFDEEPYRPEVYGAIIAMEWHPHRALLAVAHRQDAIYLYDYKAQCWLSSFLRDAYQSSISCISWNPTSSNQLAVGCSKGVFVWHVTARSGDMSSMKERELDLALLEDNKTHVLPDLKNITCLAWSPDGTYLLAGSASSGNIQLYSRVNTHETLLLKRSAVRTNEISFSPNGMYVVVVQTTSSGGLIRVIETCTWTDVLYEYENQLCNFCWLPDSSGGFFSLKDSWKIYFMRLLEPFPGTKCELECVKLLKPEQYDTRTVLNGFIDKMALSPTGNRLVVSFVPETRGSEFLALFQVKIFSRQLIGNDILMPIGYIRGPLPANQDEFSEFTEECAYAEHLKFLPNPPLQGALLSIGWNNGRVSFVPMFFSEHSTQPQLGARLVRKLC